MNLRRFPENRPVPVDDGTTRLSAGPDAGLLARVSHHPSTATTLCRTLNDFHSVRALNIV